MFDCCDQEGIGLSTLVEYSGIDVEGTKSKSHVEAKSSHDEDCEGFR